MNERIKELAGQAGAIHIHGKPKDRALVGYDNIEKFANLIIEECIQTIQMGISRDGHDTKHYLQSMKHIQEIKAHFSAETTTSTQ